MFSSIGDFASLVRHARTAASRLSQVLAESRQLRVRGTAGGGLVTVEIRGDHRVLSVEIDEALFARGDRELIEDLTCLAVSDALAKLSDAQAEKLQALVPGEGGSQLVDLFWRLMQQPPK